MRRARVVVCASEALAVRARELGARDVRVVPSGVGIPEHIGEPEDPPHVLFVGRLSVEKGVLELLEATVGIQRVVVGDGPLRELVPDAVGFVPPSMLGGYYERAAVVVCPSRREGYGVVAREAMAYGRPVVATAVGGLLDVVEDNVTGVRVPSRDPVALRAAIERVLGDAELRRRLGDVARQAARERLTWEASTERTLTIYRDVASDGDLFGSDESLAETLVEHERAWNARPLLRALYGDWFRAIASRMASGPGVSVELGSGIGRFREVVPSVVTTDVEVTAWADRVVRAEELPYGTGEVANLVLIDVFHHIASPARFLDEATRVLRPGGRILVLDPYCSPVSTILYQLFHAERTDLDAEPFDDDARIDAAPFASNQARSTLAFFRASDELVRRWPALAVVERRRLAYLAYPLSGGFTRRPLVHPALGDLLRRSERLLDHAAPLLAFRCLVVLERR